MMSKIALQMDESADDVSSAAYICQVLFRRKHPRRCHVLSAAFRERYGSDILKAANGCFTAEDVSWANGVDTCTDGAAALTGHKKGFQPKCSKMAPT
jgi:hypothetical protein